MYITDTTGAGKKPSQPPATHLRRRNRRSADDAPKPPCGCRTLPHPDPATALPSEPRKYGSLWRRADHRDRVGITEQNRRYTGDLWQADPPCFSSSDSRAPGLTWASRGPPPTKGPGAGRAGPARGRAAAPAPCQTRLG